MPKVASSTSGIVPKMPKVTQRTQTILKFPKLPPSTPGMAPQMPKTAPHAQTSLICSQKWLCLSSMLLCNTLGMVPKTPQIQLWPKLAPNSPIKPLLRANQGSLSMPGNLGEFLAPCLGCWGLVWAWPIASESAMPKLISSVSGMVPKTPKVAQHAGCPRWETSSHQPQGCGGAKVRGLRPRRKPNRTERLCHLAK